MANVAPGLTFNFKGVNTSDANLSAVYEHKIATITSELDIAGFSQLNTSVLGGSHGVQAGAALSMGLGSKCEVNDYSAAIGYKPENDKFFVGVKANNKFADLNTALMYNVKPDLSVSALVDFTPKTGAHSFNVGLGYQFCSGYGMKLKASNTGTVSASVKKQLPNKLTVVGAAGVDVR